MGLHAAELLLRAPHLLVGASSGVVERGNKWEATSSVLNLALELGKGLERSASIGEGNVGSSCVVPR